MPQTTKNQALDTLFRDLSRIDHVFIDMQKFARTHGLTTIAVQIGQLSERAKKLKQKINRRKEKTNDHRTEG